MPARGKTWKGKVSKRGMLHSHQWWTILESLCPYCRQVNKENDIDEGARIECRNCRRTYIIGDQR